MKDQISALLDGELDDAEAGRLIGRLKSEPELRRTWDDYHRVGDALRGHLAPDLSARVAARLAAEPAVLLRRSGGPSTHPVGRLALSAAASLAAVALVVWMALPMRGPFSQTAQVDPAAQQPYRNAVPETPLASGARVASTGQAASGAISELDAAHADARTHADALAALGMGNYLLAHQRFSPSSAMQGVAPYARTVSSDGDGR